VAELDQQGLEVERQGGVSESADLLTLLFEEEGIQPVQSSEVEVDLFARAVIDTSGRDHVPVSVATDGLRGEDHAGGEIIDTLHMPFVITEGGGDTNIIDTCTTEGESLTKADHPRRERSTGTGAKEYLNHQTLV